eukprot:SAG11_NODE_2736_length_3028_cov_3.460567_1_plen_192_part_00
MSFARRIMYRCASGLTVDEEHRDVLHPRFQLAERSFHCVQCQSSHRGAGGKPLRQRLAERQPPRGSTQPAQLRPCEPGKSSPAVCRVLCADYARDCFESQVHIPYDLIFPMEKPMKKVLYHQKPSLESATAVRARHSRPRQCRTRRRWCRPWRLRTHRTCPSLSLSFSLFFRRSCLPVGSTAVTLRWGLQL